jgi:hypothetical protein
MTPFYLTKFYQNPIFFSSQIFRPAPPFRGQTLSRAGTDPLPRPRLRRMRRLFFRAFFLRILTQAPEFGKICRATTKK